MHFIRHGQSEYNLHIGKTGRDPGIHDAPLTPLGFKQARQAADQLAGRGIKRIITSPYTRALQTASTIADSLGATLHVEPLAGERCLYSCDVGTFASRLRDNWRQLDFSTLPAEKWWPRMNESDAELQIRVKAFRRKWNADLQSGDCALISHYYFLNALLGRVLENGEVVVTEKF